MTTQRKVINLEQFYTQGGRAKSLSETIKAQPWFSNMTRVIEPAAGDGIWLDHMHVHEAYDIMPMHRDVVEADFLEMVENKNIVYKEGTLCIGNPPFGRMGKLAHQFMQACGEISDYIAFILPASFGKKTQIRRVPKNFHLVYQEDLLDETFRFEGDGRKVSTVFQIWERRKEERIDPPMIRECDDFEFTRLPEYSYSDASRDLIAETGIPATFRKDIEKFLKKRPEWKQLAAPCPDDTQIAICTHGAAHGKVFTQKFSDKSSRTHRYIKPKGVDASVLATRLRKLDYEKIARYTVGADCLSTAEIVDLYLEKYPEE